MDTIGESVVEFLVECIVAAVWWVALFPVVFLLTTLPIFVGAMFKRGSYFRNVGRDYRAVIEFWKEWGMILVP